MSIVKVKVGQAVVFTNKISGQVQKEAGFIANLTQDSNGNPTATVTVLNSITGLAEGYAGIPLIAGHVGEFADSAYAGYINLSDEPVEIAIPVDLAPTPVTVGEANSTDETAG